MSPAGDASAHGMLPSAVLTPLGYQSSFPALPP